MKLLEKVAEAMKALKTEFLSEKCDDCDGRYPPYMAAPITWAEAGLMFFDNVCPLCLGKRLKRYLTSKDFLPSPINDWLPIEGQLPDLSTQAVAVLRQLNLPGAYLRTRPGLAELYRSANADPERTDLLVLMELGWGHHLIDADSGENESDENSLESRIVITEDGRRYLRQRAN
jgi:hypothetical protein